MPRSATTRQPAQEPPNLESTEWKIRRIVAEEMGIAMSDVSPSKRLHADIGCDSLDSVEVALAMEEVFSVGFDDEFVADIAEQDLTVGDLMKIVETKNKETAK